MNDKLLTVDQISEYLGVHRDTVYAMIRSGRLPALQLGGRKASWRISESDLTAFIAARKAVGGRNGDGDASEIARAEERAAFERRQQDELASFQSEQAARLADFEARQGRDQYNGNGNGASTTSEGAVSRER